MKTLDVEALSLFVRAAEMSNITAAGKELKLPASVASQRLSRLEAFLGMRLLHRTTRSVSLTEDGAEFLQHAHKILAAIDDAYAISQDAPGAFQRTLKIAAPGTLARLYLQPLLRKFLDAHPGLDIDMVLSDSIQNITELGVDVAIRVGKLNDSSHVARKLGPDVRILCASPEYLARKGRPQTPADLAGHDCVLLGDERRWSFTGKDGATVRQEVDGRLRVNCGESARLAAEDGIGIVCVSVWNARASLSAGKLVQVMSDYQVEQTRDIWAIYPSARLISSKARSFVDFLAQELGQELRSRMDDDATLRVREELNSDRGE
jgi:DNA-binding transcriptional LysR family regulator